MLSVSSGSAGDLRAAVPSDHYHRELVSCQVACPVHTDARGYVRAIAEGRFRDAYLIARGPNPFASICDRICGAPCEAACRRGRIPRVDDDGRFVAADRPISIRALKRFVCDRFWPEARRPTEVLADLQNFVPPVAAGPDELAALVRVAFDGRGIHPANGQRVAIIGSGPAGLSAAHDLALLGFRPTVFEREPVAAGMLAVGVPSYRLPREIIRREVAVIEALGVEIRCGVAVGTDMSFAELRRDFAAVIVAVGAKGSRALGLDKVENAVRFDDDIETVGAELADEVRSGGKLRRWRTTEKRPLGAPTSCCLPWRLESPTGRRRPARRCRGRMRLSFEKSPLWTPWRRCGR
jgi:NADPH-dependent glutamate synthase beta subunit-like oxidoreductase